MSRHLLLLCHANIARSPSAELLAAGYLDATSGWRVTSAGTHALVGRGLDRELGAVLRARGVSVASHRSRQVDGRMLRDADLVLAFDSGQRAWITQHFPAEARRTATIRRAARLVRAAPGAEVGELVAADTAPYDSGDDVADPFGRGPAAALAAIDEIDSLLRVLLPALGAVPAGWAPPRATMSRTRHSMRLEAVAS
ncbi:MULTISPECIES: arsenate-mycothiol transferase ArsC [unclassified Rathayibacter]|uniref:arsenate-mycothiol transferase ArsC n=1 Tax=unclassified Rathayibacter TaxID=2609250 RepID=UPI0006FC83F2|nr:MULTISPECIES: low molecular weight phosphatase family protein [unclassified Rathayibacter]KQQ05646.1 hypothetical protein ASF42_03525 [Rathayibacter sp. Leaf294]KQS13505.1 hypothetical protein ASG06_03535 [Rathayibacter sp. Leaf185]